MTTMREHPPLSWRRSAVNLALLAVFAYLLWLLLQWAVLDAVWIAGSHAECLAKGADGACWASLREWAGALLFGFYPSGERWRMILLMGFFALTSFATVRASSTACRFLVVAALILAPAATVHLAGGFGGLTGKLIAISALCCSVVAMISILLRIGHSPWKLLAFFLTLAGVISVVLPDLTPVASQKWGGLALTLLVSFNLVAWGFPLGILLALGRQSDWRIVSASCTIFIETLRALPLILVLISFSIILPLIVKGAGSLDLLLRASLGLLIFTAAYFAEIVRAGLRAIPAGQTEAAAALGLGYWQRMGLILLPQAIRLMVPALLVLIANTIKDTALLSVIGLFDLMNIARAIGQDRNWLGTIWEPMLAAAALYLTLCLAISIAAERRQLDLRK